VPLALGACTVCRSRRWFQDENGYYVCEFGHQSRVRRRGCNLARGAAVPRSLTRAATIRAVGLARRNTTKRRTWRRPVSFATAYCSAA